MSTETTVRARGGRSVLFVFLPVIAVGGIYVGMRWHTTIERWLVPRAGNGSSLDVTGTHDGTSAPNPSGRGAVQGAKQLWTCGMHPQVIQDRPGECPICHMKLTPLAGGDAAGDTHGGAGASSGAVSIDPTVVQNMGVRTVLATRGTLARRVRAMATIAEPESARTDINLRVSGWIQELYADTDGMAVRKGEPLFDLHSPDLRQATEELIAARRALGSIAPGLPGDPDASDSAGASLVAAAEARLHALGLSPEQVSQLGAMNHAPATVSIVSPVDGVVAGKTDVYTGSSVMAGQLVLRLADRSIMWAEARVPEGSLRHIKLGQRAGVRVDAVDGEPILGEVVFIHPNLDDMTRTALVRVSVPNPAGLLRVGMFARAEFDAGSGEPVVILPREAIIDTGESRIVFVSRGKGRFEPRRVEIGASGDGGLIEVLSGVAPGEAVVSSGQFLIDSESRLREAIAKFLSHGADAPMNPLTPAMPGAPEAPVSLSPESSSATAPAAPTARDAKAPAELVEKVVAEYLAIAEPFGKELPNTPPAATDSLLSAIDALAVKAEGKDAARLTNTAREATLAMRSQSTEKQRELFKAVSAAVIAIVDAMPPSDAGRADLFVANCPMAKADWLQRGEDLGNPFYSEDMTECGYIVRRVGEKPGEGGNR
ncbi:MAG: efflux RND transporter periplasmic adaptor subunit [Phycisphaerae bacterium]|nr:efflux RND transporter periplasmic adaptor subunit [Phycisphaerae bacterium]